MSKRSRRSNGSRTGGTGDIKPQYLTVSSLQNVSGKYAVNQASLPVPRFGSQQGRTTVVEILSLDWYIGIKDLADAASTQWAYLTTGTDRSVASSPTLPDCQVDASDPLTFGMVIDHSASGNNGLLPYHVDLTDNNGNGMVVATDKLFIIYGLISETIVSEAVCKIKYRLVNIGMKEYIGIVQSQQA